MKAKDDPRVARHAEVRRQLEALKKELDRLSSELFEAYGVCPVYDMEREAK